MQPPPPRSTRPYTLFPSTTLCRSHPRRIHGGPAAARDPMKPQHSLLVLALAVPLALLARTPAAGGGASVGTGPTADQATTAKLVYGLLSDRSEEHTSELQSLMRISYAVFCLKKKKTTRKQHQ